MSAAAAYASTVPMGATLILGEWQHGCSASMAAKIDVLRALTQAGHRVHVLLEAREENVAQLVAEQGQGRGEFALHNMPHIYRSREFLEVITLGVHQPSVTFTGYDFRLGSATAAPLYSLQESGLPMQFRSQLSFVLKATLRPWELWAPALLHAIPPSLLEEIENVDSKAHEFVTNVRYAQLLARPGDGLGLTKNQRPRVSRTGAVAAFNFRDAWCANRIQSILADETAQPGSEPTTTVIWCAAVHAARSLASVVRPVGTQLFVSLAEQLQGQRLTFTSLGVTAKSGEYLDSFRLAPVPVPVSGDKGWLENRVPTGIWLTPERDVGDIERAAFLGDGADAVWSNIYDRVYVAQSTEPISLIAASET